MATNFRVVLDACVMLPQTLNNLLLTLAEHRMFTPVWTPDLLNEVERNLTKPDFGLTKDQARHRLTNMQRAFPHAADHATGYTQLIPAMNNHRKDRHVLAAAVAAGAALIVTNNLRDFPDKACRPHEVEAVSADEFLLDQLDLDSDTVLAAMSALVERNRFPPRTILDLAEALWPLTPQFATAVIDTMQPAAALQIVEDADIEKLFPHRTAQEILHSPLAVARTWWRSLLDADTQTAATLTINAQQWDFAQVADALEGYRLTTGVHEHTDRSDVVYLKFIAAPGGHSLRSFAEFVVTDYRVLALQQGADGTWQIHGMTDAWPRHAARRSQSLSD